MEALGRQFANVTHCFRTPMDQLVGTDARVLRSILYLLLRSKHRRARVEEAKEANSLFDRSETLRRNPYPLRKGVQVAIAQLYSPAATHPLAP